MRIKFNVPEYSISAEYQYTNDLFQEGKAFPVLSIGKDSYIEEAVAEFVPDENLLYNIQIGRYSSIAGNVTFLVDMNHDYRKVCQGRISGIPYRRPERTKRKGQIIIMNDCWIGDNVTLLSGVTIGNGGVIAAGSVVSSNIPPYAIAAGNPAKIIGYRFQPEQIDALNLIRWWNWPEEKIKENASILYGDINTFLSSAIKSAQTELSNITPANITPIPKKNCGEDKRLLYIPDFEQDYPTYPQVIEAFIHSYSDTNHELLLYIKEDSLLEDKLFLLNQIFEKYEDANCYINLYIGNIADERKLFCQADYYITNRNPDNVYHMDLADLFSLSIVSSVDIPIFFENDIEHMVKAKKDSSVQQPSTSSDNTIKDFIYSVKTLHNNLIETQNFCNKMSHSLSQLSTNQVAMNQAVNNLKYEIAAPHSNYRYPIVKPGEEAIELILKEKKSLCRLGDGEFSVIAGINRQKFQRADAKLGKRLQEVLQSKKENIIVCIPDFYGDLSKYNDDCRYNTRAYLTEDVRKQHYALLDFKRTYYDAFLTRPYASYIDNNTNAPQQRFAHLKQIWNNRDLLIIEGEKTRMGIGNDLFDNASSIIRILGPAEHAFDRYDDILKEALQQDKERLVLIAMGATATVLAYDLALAGFQALDIGHIDIEYEWMLAGTGKKTAIANKYNNEVAGGDVVEDISNPDYESQIIAKYI
ncbi:MAG: GT-D fold domain-containing glycosyltransferase [Lachnospiraceae bacterium]